MKKHGIILLIGISLGLIIFLFLAYDGEIIEKISLSHLFCAGMTGVAVAYMVFILTQNLDKWILWQTYPGSRLFLGIVLNFVAAFAFIYGLIRFYFSIVDTGAFQFAELNPVFIKLAIILFFLVLIYSVIYFALYSYFVYARVQIETVQLDRKQIDLQLNALKSQLSPHFLFNSLNTISSLIFKDVSKAETFIRMLAKSYQYTLTSYDKKWISLREELAFVESYRYLLKTRFEDNFQLSIDIPQAIQETKIPPLTLQMLVENAAKHNQTSQDSSLNIQIEMEGQWIRVSNNKTKTPDNVSSFQIGLDNIKARYEILTQQKIQVTDAERFTVKLPLVS